MSWHYLQGQEEASWEGTCLDGAPDALLSLMPTPEPSCSPDRPMDACLASRSGTMSPPLTGSPGEDISTSSAGDFRAKTSPPLERERGSRVPDQDSGVRWHELSVRYDPGTSSWKTHRCLFQEDLQQSSVTLPRWGLMLDGVCWERTTLAHLTSGIGSGFWLTPKYWEDRGERYTPETSYRHWEEGRQVALSQVVRDQRMWPTPTRSDHIHSFAINPRKNDQRGGDTLGERVQKTGGDGGKLNPTWVEWLMGWPLGFTDLKQSATDRFRQWLRSHGASLEAPLSKPQTTDCSKGDGDA